MTEVQIILDNIRSAHNVGSMFRTADGAGVAQIYLVGYTPAPIDRFGRQQPEISKTSLRATDSVPWQSIPNENIVSLLRKLQQNGFTIVAVEQTQHSVPLSDLPVLDKVVYIFGAEVEGVSTVLLEAADIVVEIPMRGQKESLNVSVTAGVILFARQGC